MRRLALLATLFATNALAAPAALPKEKEERRQAYNACLYYSAKAWDDGFTQPDMVARRIIYKCDKSLRKLAEIYAQGARNEPAREAQLISEIRADLGTAVATVWEVREEKSRQVTPAP